MNTHPARVTSAARGALLTPLLLGLAMAHVVGLAADFKGTLALSDSSQASLRPALTRDGTALDLETTPYATLGFDWDKSNISIGYGPRFMLRDVFEDRQPSLLHGAYATYGHSGPRYHFALSEAVTYGTQSLLTLSFLAPPQAMPTPSAAPAANQLGPQTAQTVRVASESTLATLDYAWSHRWASTFTASYGISGGLDQEAQAVLPRVRTAAGGATLDYTLGRHDELDTGVGFSHSLISSGYDNWTVTLSETWKHVLTKELTSSVGAGIGWFTSKDPHGIRNSGPFPVAYLGLDGTWIILRRRSYAITLQAGSSITPVVNMYSGTLQTRAQISSTLGIVGKKSSLSFTLFASRALPLSAADVDSVSVIGAGILATHNPAKFIQISAGYRNAWQSANGANTVPQLWMAFLGLTLYAPPVHF